MEFQTILLICWPILIVVAFLLRQSVIISFLGTLIIALVISGLFGITDSERAVMNQEISKQHTENINNQKSNKKESSNKVGQYDAKIQTLKDDGVIYKIQKTNAMASTVWVGPSFYTLNYDDKNLVLGIVYLNIYPNDKRNMLFLTDSMSGKSIGKFVPLQGGLIMN